MRRISVSLTLLPAALAAQAPAPAPAPAAPVQAPAPSLDAQYKAQAPAINALLKTDPQAALAKVEALIPAQIPAFDKTNLKTAQASINDYESLADLYSMGANAAMNMGQWEKAKDYAAKAKSTSQATYDNALAPLTAFQDTWKAAQADAQKKLDEEATLSKIEKPTADQIKALQDISRHEDVYKANVANGQKMVDAVNTSLNGLKAAPSNYDAAISDIDKHLKDEADYLAKPQVKGDKKIYANALAKSAATNPDKAAAMAGVRRALVVDPGNKEATHALGILNGTIPPDPAPAKSHRKKSK